MTKKIWEMDYVIEKLTEEEADDLVYTLRHHLIPAQNRKPIWAEYREERDEDGLLDSYWRIRCLDVPEFYAMCRENEIADFFIQFAERHNTFTGGGIRPKEIGEGQNGDEESG
jgi:hypothetical protein